MQQLGELANPEHNIAKMRPAVGVAKIVGEPVCLRHHNPQFS
jgi:hypothetical protein